MYSTCTRIAVCGSLNITYGKHIGPVRNTCLSTDRCGRHVSPDTVKVNVKVRLTVRPTLAHLYCRDTVTHANIFNFTGLITMMQDLAIETSTKL